MNIEIEFTEKQTLFEKTVEKTQYTLYGGAKGGGKSHGLRLLMLLRRLKYPGSRSYIFRQTYSELERNHITPLFEQFPELEKYYVKGEKCLYLPNNSQLRFAYVEHAKDLKKFQGLDTHDLAIEEAGEWRYDHFEYIDTQRRSAKDGIPTRTILTGNPGGLGHSWLKRLFITKKYQGNERPEDYAFVPALVDDNPFLMKNDPRYIERLENIKNEMLRRAFRHGDWDITAGQFFDCLDRGVHIVKPFEIPAHWKKQLVYDWGYGHPAGFQWWASNEFNQHFCYRSWYQAKTQISEQAEMLRSFKDFNSLKTSVIAGQDCWAKRFGFNSDRDGGPTVSELFLNEGIILRPANTDRIHGANQVREALSFKMVTDNQGKEEREGPQIFFFENCEIDFDCLSRMTHDPQNIEDVLKVDAKDGDPWTGDEAYDLTRYYVMDRLRASRPLKKEVKDMYTRKRPSRPSGWAA